MAENPLRTRCWRLLERRWQELTFDGLESDEKEVVALFWLEGEVMNGGMHQYFFNSSGDLAFYAESALRRVGADRSLVLLQSCMSKFGPDYPIDREQRNDLLDRLGWEHDPFDFETRELQKLPEKFLELGIAELDARYLLSQQYG